MNKILLSGNYVVISVRGKELDYPKSLTYFFTDGVNFRIKKTYGGEFRISIDEIERGTWFESNGTTPFTVESLTTFLRNNTAAI